MGSAQTLLSALSALQQQRQCFADKETSLPDHFMRTILFSWLAGCVLMATLPLNAQQENEIFDGLPKLSADNQEFDAENNRLIASGNVEITHQGLLIQSDRVTVEQATAEITATGNVRITQGDFRVISERSSYNYQTNVITADDFRLGAYPFYVEGKRLSGTVDDLAVEDGILYYQQPDPYGLSVAADNYQLTGQESLAIDDARLRIGDTPVFFLPGATYDVTQDSPLFYTGDIGHRADLGGYWQNRLLIRVTPELRAGANVDGYTERGILGGPVVRYQTPEDYRLTLSGEVDTGFTHDLGSARRRGNDRLGQQIERSRHYLFWRQLGHYDKSVDHATSINWWSDSEVTRDFREDLFFRNQLPDNYTETSWRGTDATASLFLRVQPNDYIETTQRLPDVSYRKLPGPVVDDSWLHHRYHVGFVHLIENDITDRQRDLKTNRINGYYGLTAPIEVTPWLAVTPVVGTLATHYAGNQPDRGTYTRILGEFGFDASALMTGSWELENDIWDIDGLRHTFRPVLQYRYIPAADSGNREIPRIDRAAPFDSFLEPLGLATRRDIDDLYEENTVRIGLEQLLQTRRAETGNATLASFDVYQDFRFSRRPARAGTFTGPGAGREDDASDVHSTVTLHPADWLTQRIFTRVDPGQMAINQVSTRTTINSAEKWTLGFGNDYVKDAPLRRDIHQYTTTASYRINERNRVNGLWRVDAALGDFTEQSYGWQTRLGNAWEMELRFTVLEGNSRESDYEVSLRAKLLTF